MNSHGKINLPISCKYHDHQRNEYENKLTALIYDDPDFSNFVDKIGSSEPDFHKLLFPIYLGLILRVSLNHVTVPFDRLINHLNILRAVLNLIPDIHLFLNINSDSKVHEINDKFLPDIFSVDLESNKSEILSYPERHKIEDKV